MTVAPARTASGAKRFEVPPPAENSAMSTPAKLDSVSSRTGSGSPRNGSVLPAERAEANSRSSREREASLLEAADQLDARRRRWRRRSRPPGGEDEERADMRVTLRSAKRKGPVDSRRGLGEVVRLSTYRSARTILRSPAAGACG